MDYKLIIELSFILFGALVGGIVASKLKQPLVIGYIIAGLILGTFLPKLLGPSNESIFTLSEVGVALLLFTLGLEFSLDRIKKVGKNAVIGAILQIIIVIAVFTFIFYFAFNFNLNVALFLSSIISLSSTAVVAKILSEGSSSESSHGDLILSWLVVQDIAVIPLMLLIPVVSDFSNFDPAQIFLNVIKSGVSIYLVLILGKKTIPYLFKKLALYNNRELMLVAAFLFCLSVGALANLLGISFAVGAFLAGVLLSSSAFNHEVFTEIRPLRDVFSSIFFVSLGFLVDIQGVLNNFVFVLVLTLLIFLIKFLVVFIILVRLNYHSKISFYSAIALFQIGEFGFLLAKIGINKNIISSNDYQLIILSSITTLVLTPILYNFSTYFYKKIKILLNKYFPYLHRLLFIVADSDAKLPMPRRLKVQNHLILVGYGRVGKYIAKILDLSQINYVVIDLHYKTLQSLRKKGVLSVYGDAVNSEVLLVAGAQNAKGVIIATPDIISNELIVQNLRSINPGISIVARAHRDEDIAKLAVRGIKHIIEPEFEAGVEMGKRMLKAFDVSSKNIKYFVTQVRKERVF